MADLQTVRADADLILDRTDLSDAQKNSVINRAQRWLDRNAPSHPKMVSRHQVAIATGDYQVTFNQARAVKKVWVQKSATDERTELAQAPLHWFRNMFGKDLSQLDTGTPCYYAHGVFGLSPDQKSLTSTDFTNDGLVDWDDIIFGDHWAKDGIIFGPPADQAYTLTVFAHFYSPTLSSDTDVSYWTTRHPEILVRAYFYMLEIEARNREGAQEWKEVLLDDLREIDFDMVERTLGDAGEMTMRG